MDKVKQYVDYIKESIEEMKQDKKNDYNFGVVVGYVESLSILKSLYDEDEWKAIGLDFDLDKKYLV